ncbi:cation diffusion facilitator family transporter [Lichenihabitans sp. PAMC28606]|uniref:cation diffusion facilitator family transporter n=1 Tax=Lichenihabitans sp. PAMC28606 TaxID=2880932 RepID=UPI001D09C59F|nr:cation diffusion facilitator family transporter [Lichenihabitans sp. PAMC28606]UDL94324.1 cation diffusion facilitator family transporter [Lichenihabitans sp. PAMC28606]
MDSIQRIALGSIGVGLLVLALKYLAFWLTGSVALYSDALESIINVITAVAAFMAVRLSAKPADRNHPYGHHKAEYLSVVLEGVCIVLAAFSILREAYFAVLAPHPIEAPLKGLLISGVGTLINAAWGYLLIRRGRTARSPALVADGKHLFVDVYTSIGVVIGVGLVILTGVRQLDAIVAALVAVNIIWSGWGLMKESIAGLMDEAAPVDLQDQIRAVLMRHLDGTIEVHDLKTRSAGRVTFIEFHLVVEGRMSVSDSHAICDKLERVLQQAVDGALVTIHVEPEHKAKQTGSMVVSTGDLN